ncbi:MAG: FtsX-like permease family protein [Bacteroidetes bacterium]|nr:MAG: FtsX-like permease family protein [Bacteroidota bacterium]
MNHLLRITYRRMTREKLYTIVNILGLSLGMASALLIFLFIRFETTYDTYHNEHERIYRVGSDFSIHDQREGYAVSSAPLGPKLVEEFDEIESCLRIFYMRIFFRDLVFQHQNSRITERGVYAADANFFDFFNHTFLEGKPETALSKPFSMVLTRSMAMKYFGTTALEGTKVELKNAGFFTITAVIEDLPLNTHLQFNALVSLSTIQQMPGFFAHSLIPGVTWETFEKTFGSFIVWTYIKTAEGFNPSEFLQNQWPGFDQKYQSGLISSIAVIPILQPIASIHLDSDLLYEVHSDSTIIRLMNRQITLAFIVIALFLLLIAAINYTNIAIGHFNKRRKELAMLKILGSSGSSLFSGFFAESFITALTGLVLALLMLELFIPHANQLLTVSLSLNLLQDFYVPLIILFVFLVTAFLSGVFPAFYFAWTPAIQLLESRSRPGKKSLVLKKILITLQFSIATLMIVAMFIISAQFGYMQNMDWGYNTHHIAAIEIKDRELKSAYPLLDSLLKNNPLVKRTAKTNYVFSTFPIKNSTLFHTESGEVYRSYYTINTTREYLDLMGVKTEGTPLSGELFDSQQGVFVNRMLADSVEFAEPLESKVTTHFQFLEGKLRTNRKIAGVLDNFHYLLLNTPVDPLVVLPMRGPGADYLVVEFNPAEKSKQVKAIHNAWSLFDPGNPPDFFFIEDNIEAFYAHQRNVASFFGYFAWVAVFIAFLGVYGITAYNITQRKTEIGIRKVMGAGSVDILVMLINAYFALFILGFLLGSGLGWLLLKSWLETYAYATRLNFWHFAGAFHFVALTVFTAIGLHIYKIRSLNPSVTLREE